MKSAAIRAWLFAGLLACFVSSGTAQQIPAVGAGNDPRVGLKAGLHDAGEADRVDRLQTGKERGAVAILDRLTVLAAQIDRDAAGASGRDAVRLRSLASTLRGRVAKFR